MSDIIQKLRAHGNGIRETVDPEQLNDLLAIVLQAWPGLRADYEKPNGGEERHREIARSMIIAEAILNKPLGFFVPDAAIGLLTRGEYNET